MFDLENIENGDHSLEQGAGGRLTDSQMDYLRELQPNKKEWDGMTELQRDEVMGQILQRYGELSLPDDFNIQESIGYVFDPHVMEQYERLEAPHDHVQIEAIGETLANYEDLRWENWQDLEFVEKIEVLNDVETRIAAIEHRPPCPVRTGNNMGKLEVTPYEISGHMGGYRTGTKDITLNPELLTSDNPMVYREMLDTLVHEGRHAYQDFNVNVCEVHPRHSEVQSWSENMAGGKWGYWGDCSNELGQRLYEQQAIEIDARNFAHDVLNNWWNRILET